MGLSPAQLATLKAHIALNTNLVGGGTAINATPNDGASATLIAAWYNGLALGGDSQPFAAPLLVWRPLVTTSEMARAIVWSAQPSGADDAARTVAWLKWQSMTWDSKLDYTDTQVRQGLADVWGAGSATETALKAKPCGRQDGTRLEILYSPAGVGGGRVCPIFGVKVSADEVEQARSLPG